MAHIELSRRAQRDLRGLRGAARDVAEELSEALRGASSEGADIVALRGRSPWLRLRLGDYRVVFRRMDEREAESFGAVDGYLVARIVHRRELERAVAGLR